MRLQRSVRQELRSIGELEEAVCCQSPPVADHSVTKSRRFRAKTRIGLLQCHSSGIVRNFDDMLLRQSCTTAEKLHQHECQRIRGSEIIHGRSTRAKPLVLPEAALESTAKVKIVQNNICSRARSRVLSPSSAFPTTYRIKPLVVRKQTVA